MSCDFSPHLEYINGMRLKKDFVLHDNFCPLNLSNDFAQTYLKSCTVYDILHFYRVQENVRCLWANTIVKDLLEICSRVTALAENSIHDHSQNFLLFSLRVTDLLTQGDRHTHGPACLIDFDLLLNVWLRQLLQINFVSIFLTFHILPLFRVLRSKIYTQRALEILLRMH